MIGSSGARGAQSCLRAQVEANDVDGMRAMIEREVACQQDDDLRIGTSNFDATRGRLSAPVEFTIGIQAEPDIATQRKVAVSLIRIRAHY